VLKISILTPKFFKMGAIQPQILDFQKHNTDHPAEHSLEAAAQ